MLQFKKGEKEDGPAYLLMLNLWQRKNLNEMTTADDIIYAIYKQFSGLNFKRDACTLTKNI